MRLFWLTFCVGWVLFYFADQAVKYDSLTVEGLINNLYHFFAGFIFITWMFKSNIKNKFKSFIILLIVILVLDETYDYFRHVKDFGLIMLIYHLYLVFWGAASGLMISKHLTRTKNGLANK